MYRLSIKLKVLFVLVVILLSSQQGVGSVFADTIGEKHTFFVNSKYNATGQNSIPATLVHVSGHAYFYVEDAYLNNLNMREVQSLNQQIATVAQEFDYNIYPKQTVLWGSEANPGIDNDPKITILLERLTSGTGGYFDSVNQYSSDSVERTNQREMITLNVSALSNDQLKIFLAHELQHLISFNQKELTRKVSEEVWLNELRSQYAITMAGYNDIFQTSDLRRRVQVFLDDPEDSLTEWPNTNTDYASVTLFGQYLVDRFGPSILKDTLQDQSTGIESINRYFIKNNSPNRFTEIFSDWMWANYFNDSAQDSRYGYINPNLQNMIISPTDNRQLSAQTNNSFSYLLKPWQSSWYRFIGDLSTPTDKNIKISWEGNGFQIFYGDSSGVKQRVGNGDIIAVPTSGNFILMPVNESKTSIFGSSEATAPLVLSIEYTSDPVSTSPAGIQDGTLIMHAGTPDIYVVTGPYKRYLAPAILKFYGLEAPQAVTVSEAVFQSYMPTNYIREVNEQKVYAVWPDGTKHWLNMSAQHFTDSHRDWNAIFIVNNLESNFYKIGPDITQ